LLLFSISGLIRASAIYTSANTKRKIAILIPTYKEDAIILDSAKNALRQDYPSDKFDVFVIADQLKDETLSQLKILPINLITVSFEKSTKAKSLKFALQAIPEDDYSVIMILDSDNIMTQGCLEKINHAFDAGYKIVQLHRTAKNRNTPIAILDAISEEINNHIFRKGHRALGLSSALIGSGMAFTYEDFKSVMTNTDIEDNPGEDREIYLELLKKGITCEYIDGGLIFDEKVSSRKILEKQRTRWISAQLQYARRFWLREFFRTFSYNIHYFDYAVQTILLPRVILLLSISSITILSIFLGIATEFTIYPNTFWWTILAIGCTVSFIISIYKKISLKELWKAISGLPGAIYAIGVAFSNSNANQKDFIHTPKEFLSFDEKKLNIRANVTDFSGKKLNR